ncbi:CinA family protein [Marinomonas mediterranea]|uniref:CinA family protein n=1 Tax=Marinomonas mediterranea TaxID=119864 RepID=UPI00234A04C6|nr:CinA family protein [Marinomonas mediterranea]WCN08070.1 nicotinamide-nucleotide amidohydrolase family protein [Marinomonas mediterranea]WCN12164.1 nicotinamide-nucleotide amidohydrolase family protein [Marinomonas mediterranea]
MNDLEREINDLATQAAGLLIARGWMLVTAESCTGGLIGASCTELAGSSAWFFGGVISYDNAAKMKGLNVSEQTLIDHGAVSEQTVKQMCAGALNLGGDLAVAVSGVAGPSGGTTEKPVGCVYIGWQKKGQEAQIERCQFDGDRKDVRLKTVVKALEGVVTLAK